jgi:ERCC4-type nuclease
MIYIDSNEESMCQVPNYLRSNNVPTMTLSQGFDYIIKTDHASVAVERKRAGDYLQSMESGHLNNQLVEMSRNFQLSYLLVYGDMNEALFKSGKYPNAYISSLIGDSLKYSSDGLQGQVITINDTAISTDTDVASFLTLLHKKLESNDFIRLPRIIRVKYTEEDYAIRVLVQFPSIGEKRAKDILKTHHNLQNFFSTLIYQPDLINIKGLTPDTVSLLHNILTQNYQGEK